MAFCKSAFKYEHTENCAKIPEFLDLSEVVPADADQKDRIVVFHHGDHPMLNFEPIAVGLTQDEIQVNSGLSS